MKKTVFQIQNIYRTFPYRNLKKVRSISLTWYQNGVFYIFCIEVYDGSFSILLISHSRTQTILSAAHNELFKDIIVIVGGESRSQFQVSLRCLRGTRLVNYVHFNFRWQSSTRSYLQIAAREGTLQGSPGALEIRPGDEKMQGIQVRGMRRKRKQFSVAESLHGGMRRWEKFRHFILVLLLKWRFFCFTGV